MSGARGIPAEPIAIALAAGAIEGRHIRLIGEPAAAYVRRAVVAATWRGRSGHEALSAAGWSAGEISRWVRSARLPCG